MSGALSHLLYERLIEDRLSHHVASTSGNFTFKTRDLGVEIFRVWIERAANNEIGRIFKVFAGKVVTLIQARDNFHQLDRINIIDGRGARVVTELRRVPSQRQDVSDAQSGDSHEFTLQADEVFVAATNVEQRHYIVLLLEYRPYRQIAHPQNCQRIVRKSDGIAA